MRTVALNSFGDLFRYNYSYSTFTHSPKMAGEHDHETVAGNAKNGQHQHSADGTCCHDGGDKERVAPTIFDAIKAG